MKDLTIEDFVKKCEALEIFIILMISHETSDRVKTSVFIEMLKEIINRQENKEDALKQVISALNNEELPPYHPTCVASFECHYCKRMIELETKTCPYCENKLND